MTRTVVRSLCCFALSGLVAGCGGGGGGGTGGQPAAPAVLPTDPPAVTSGQGVFTIRVPQRASKSNAARPAYVSPSTNSVSFQVLPAAAQIVPLSLGGSSCPLSGGFYTCTATFQGPVGTSTMVIKAYASSNGTGPVLSQNSVPITIVVGQANPVTVVLNGVVATLTLGLVPGSVTSGQASNVQATWGAKDASNNVIVGPGSLVDAGGNPIVPTLSSSSTHFVITGAPPTWNIAYDGTAVPSPAITVSASGFTSVSATLAVNPAGISANPSSLYVEQTGPLTVTVTDAGYSGNFTVTSSNPSVVSVTSPIAATGVSTAIPITIDSAGSAIVTITDSNSQQVVVPVVVTLTPVTISLGGGGR